MGACTLPTLNRGRSSGRRPKCMRWRTSAGATGAPTSLRSKTRTGSRAPAEGPLAAEGDDNMNNKVLVAALGLAGATLASAEPCAIRPPPYQFLRFDEDYG